MRETGRPGPAADPGTRDLCGQVLAHLERTVRTLAGEVQEVKLGWAVRTAELPLMHTMNQLHVTAAGGAEEVLAAAAEHQEDLPYRHVVVEEPTTARGLDAGLDRDWRRERLVLMVLRGHPRREVDPRSVVELDEGETDELMRLWAIEDGHDKEEGVLDQLCEYQRREARVWDERRFGVRSEAGAPLSVTKLRSHAGTAWVEDVYTVPAARGHGHARTLVTYATERARVEGRELTFIVADDRDWPKHLYAEIGFRPVGYLWSFHQDRIGTA